MRRDAGPGWLYLNMVFYYLTLAAVLALIAIEADGENGSVLRQTGWMRLHGSCMRRQCAEGTTASEPPTVASRTRPPGGGDCAVCLSGGTAYIRVRTGGREAGPHGLSRAPGEKEGE
jgi:hypothetical protein